MLATECGLSGCSEHCDLQCSKCKKVKYCCRDHQQLDWATHKKTCVALRTNIPQATPQNMQRISCLYATHLIESLAKDLYPSVLLDEIYLTL